MHAIHQLCGHRSWLLTIQCVFKTDRRQKRARGCGVACASISGVACKIGGLSILSKGCLRTLRQARRSRVLQRTASRRVGHRKHGCGPANVVCKWFALCSEVTAGPVPAVACDDALRVCRFGR